MGSLGSDKFTLGKRICADVKILIKGLGMGEVDLGGRSLNVSSVYKSGTVSIQWWRRRPCVDGGRDGPEAATSPRRQRPPEAGRGKCAILVPRLPPRAYRPRTSGGWGKDGSVVSAVEFGVIWWSDPRKLMQPSASLGHQDSMKQYLPPR